MKILFYQYKNTNVFLNSTYVHITELCDNLERKGNLIVYADGKYHSTINAKNNTKKHRILFRSLKSLLDNIKQSLLHSNDFFIFFTALSELKLFILALVTVLLNKPDIVYSRHRIINSAYLISNLFRLPLVVEVNGLGIDELRSENNGSNLSFNIIDKLERLSFSKNIQYIVVTKKLKEVLIKEYVIPENKISIIENGVNTQLFRPISSEDVKRELNLDNKFVYIGFVGIFSNWHGIEILIKSLPFILQVHPNVKLLIVGDGHMKNHLIKLADNLGVSNNIIFVGIIPYESVYKYINACDLCTLPSAKLRNNKIGNSALKLCEYLACGKPVIASRVAGLEFLEENNCGFLVNLEDHFEFAQKINKILENPQVKKQMGENAINYVVENRTWESIANKVADVCQRYVDHWRNT